jgi:hypothetical protein
MGMTYSGHDIEITQVLNTYVRGYSHQQVYTPVQFSVCFRPLLCPYLRHTDTLQPPLPPKVGLYFEIPHALLAPTHTLAPLCVHILTQQAQIRFVLAVATGR